MEFSLVAFVMTATSASRFSRYLAVFLRWLLIAASVFALTLWAGLYIRDNFLPKTYLAKAQIEVPAADLVTPGKAFGLDSGTLQPGFEGAIRAPDFLLPIIKNLDLETVWANQAEPSAQDKVPDVDALTHLENMMSLTASKEGNLVTIGISSSNPERAAEIANAIADQYQAVRGGAPDGATPTPENSPDQQALLAQIAKQQKVVDDKKAEVEQLRGQFGDDAVSRSSGLEKKLAAAQEEYAARLALQDKVAGVTDDEFIQTLTGAGDMVADFNQQLAILQAKTPPNREEISDLIARYRHAMKINLDMAKSRVARLQKQAGNMAAISQEQSPAYRQALLDLDREQGQLDALIARSKSAGPTAPPATRADLVQIVTRAVAPTEPIRPNKQIDFVVIIVGSSIAAVLAASFAEVIFMLVRASNRTDN